MQRRTPRQKQLKSPWLRLADRLSLCLPLLAAARPSLSFIKPCSSLPTPGQKMGLFSLVGGTREKCHCGPHPHPVPSEHVLWELLGASSEACERDPLSEGRRKAAANKGEMLLLGHLYLAGLQHCPFNL